MSLETFVLNLQLLVDKSSASEPSAVISECICSQIRWNLGAVEVNESFGIDLVEPGFNPLRLWNFVCGCYCSQCELYLGSSFIHSYLGENFSPHSPFQATGLCLPFFPGRTSSSVYFYTGSLGYRTSFSESYYLCRPNWIRTLLQNYLWELITSMKLQWLRTAFPKRIWFIYWKETNWETRVKIKI